MKRQRMDTLRVAGGAFTLHERKLRKALRDLIKASDDVALALDLAGMQYDTGALDLIAPEIAELKKSAAAAGTALKGGAP